MRVSSAATILQAAACIFFLYSPASAENAEAGPSVEQIVVFGRALKLIGEAEAGSQGVVGYSDFESRPLSRVGELVEVIPGVVATQHSGTGKANQYFLRGFNLDHGTDFAGFIDGVPINMRSHGHGQGYLDLNFIIPEIVERIEYRKGPYYADIGDFTSAGTASFKTYDRMSQGIAEATIGDAGYRRGLAAGSFDAGAGSLLLAGEAVFSDSPFVLDEDLKKFNGFAKYSTDRWRLSASAYKASWNSTDQVPQRAIDSGFISRLGYIDPDLGGETERIALNGEADLGGLSLSVYAIYYNFSLFSDFTYFLEDPVNGDEIEQMDRRLVFGGSAAKPFRFDIVGKPATLTIGGDWRYDDIFKVGLFHTAARNRFGTVRDDSVGEFSLAGYGELSIALTNRLRASAGLRADYYRYDVNSQMTLNSGSGDDAILAPKAGLAWRVRDTLEFYANYGEGFHSNDARGATTRLDPATLDPASPVDLLVRSRGAELGARFERGRFNAALVGFWLDLDSELVFVGDAGTTEPTAASRRFGVEFNAFWRPVDRIALDASAAYTDPRFRDVPSTEDRIPQAVGSVIAVGATIEPFNNLTTTIRLRHFGKAPLIEDGSVFSEPTSVVNLGAYYTLARIRLGLDVLNLFSSKDADITYFYESQLPGEPAPVDDVHLHPVEPRQIRGSLRVAL